MPKIVIPTYKRPQILRDKTLAFLKKHNVPEHDINIYVANEDERKEYAGCIEGDYIWHTIGKAGIGHARNFISQDNEYYKWLLWIDDDIEKVMKLEGKELNGIPDLHELVTDMIATAEGIGSGQVGIYPVTNHFFMKDRVATGLKFVIGCFCLTKNDPECEPRHFNLIEDFERTLKYYVKYGVSCRYENIAVKTNYMSPVGGIGKERTKENKEAEVDRFIEMFREYCTKRHKANDQVDIRFNKNNEVVFNFKLWLDQLNIQKT